jgi:hypothetical protein
VKQPRKIPKDKGYRRYSIKLKKILYNGFFIKFPLDGEVETSNEDRIRLWRAVVDQMLKDIINHHMVERNFSQYYDARVFFDDQLTYNGQECILAFLDPTKTHDRVMKIERLCRVLRERGIQF